MFQKDGELPSSIIIERFKEAVSNGFLSLQEVSSVIDSEDGKRKMAEAEAIQKASENRLAAEAEQTRLAEKAKKVEEVHLTEKAKKLLKP